MARSKNGSDHLPLTEAQAEELDRRLVEYQRDREPGVPWREALAEIRRGLGLLKPED